MIHALRWLLISLLAVLAAALSPLSGCSPQETRLGRAVAEAIGIDPYALPDGAKREIARFQAVYATYAIGGGGDRLEHFVDAYKRVRADYVRPPADAVLIDAAIKGVVDKQPAPHSLAPAEVVETALDAMLASLDPHSAYLNAEELRQTMISTNGEFGGLGIEIVEDDGNVKIIAPIEGTPAHRAGLLPGDIITHLDGVSIKGWNLVQSVARLRGRPGTDIKLTIARPSHQPFEVTLTRAVIRIEPVRWRAEGDIGYVRVATFSRMTADAVAKAVQALREQLGAGLRGLVVDMRNNPGGLLAQSVAVADEFLEGGPVVAVRGRDPGRSEVYEAKPGEIARGLPVVVLINGGSASASEIVAVALQDQGRALIMGARSFGKGTVQTIMPLPREGGLRMTTALYYSPRGRAIQARGVEPDIAVVAEGEAPLPREADLPHAIQSDADRAEGRPRVTVRESECPAAGPNGTDRRLGCALVYLRAGTIDRFLAALATRT